MREVMDNTDGFGGVDDVIRQASNLDLSDDYKEVKSHTICLIQCLLVFF